MSLNGSSQKLKKENEILQQPLLVIPNETLIEQSLAYFYVMALNSKAKYVKSSKLYDKHFRNGTNFLQKREQKSIFFSNNGEKKYNKR
jgi:uncharacterized protein YxeA